MRFAACELNKTKLPTKREVVEYLLFLKKQGTADLPKNNNLYCYLSVVINDLCLLWFRASIPIIVKSSVRRFLVHLVKKYYDVSKHPQKYIEDEWNTVFAIAKCKCGVETNLKCTCSAINQIPLHAKKFFIDQCGPRLLSLEQELIGTIETEMADISSAVEMQSDMLSDTHQHSEYSMGYFPCSSDEEEFEASHLEALPQTETELKVSDISLRNYSMALDRSDTSHRFGSLLATTLIKDLRISIAAKANKDFPDLAERLMKFFDGLIIDKIKIQRERTKCRAEIKKANKSNSVLNCISYDGKKDETRKKNIILNKVRLCTVVEEHITLVKEPSSKFIGFTTPIDGTGEEIQRAITNFMNEENYSMDHLVAINCDGAAVNTGQKKGVNVCMERHLQRSLQWNVCLFHFNELPLKALLTNFFGKQKGPGTWPGEFGDDILHCEKRPISQVFEPIAMGSMPSNIDGWNMRSDQRYLYRVVVAVNNGTCDEQLANEKPGPVSTARWLTTASRILRLYISSSQPNATLRILVNFIVKIYAPFWFLVKSQPQAIHGSRHVFKYLCWIRLLPLDIQVVIRRTIEYNAYYFHPENILLAMITDPEQTVRCDGYAKIRAAQDNPPPRLREFHVPRHGIIKFACDSYINMIDWDKITVTEPPCLQFYTDEDIQRYQYTNNEIIKIPDFLCYSQNTERFVRVVSESALAVTDENRLSHIFAKLESRERYTQLESRQDLL